MAASHRRPLRLFQSYSHVDYEDVRSLIRRLGPNLEADSSVEFDLWSDRQILLGTHWDKAIRAALANADAGLLLLTPAALASGYIQRVEIPALVATGKLLLVGLRPVDFGLQMSLELQALQVYRLQTATGRFLSFTECRTGFHKDAFAQGLYRSVRNRLAINITPSVKCTP
jgi:TIR domain